MIKTMPQAGGRKRPLVTKHPVKLTALLYLKEALAIENYEACAGIIQTAKEFGAGDFEVKDLLEDPRRAPE